MDKALGDEFLCNIFQPLTGFRTQVRLNIRNRNRPVGEMPESGSNTRPSKRMMSRSMGRGAFLSAERTLPILASRGVRISDLRVFWSRGVRANTAALRKFGPAVPTEGVSHTA